MKETEIQENLVGDTVLSSTRKKEKGVSKIVSVKLSEVETKLGAGTVE